MTSQADRSTSTDSAINAAWPYLAMIALALAIFLLITFIPGGEPATAAERFERVGSAFATLPDWVKQWMTFQHYVFAGSLLFIAWHPEARVYLAGLILSHAISYAEIALAPADRLGLGLVSLNHLVWLPALVFMLRRYGVLDKRTPYGLWYHLVLFQLCFSLIFDIRDSVGYVFSFLA